MITMMETRCTAGQVWEADAAARGAVLGLPVGVLAVAVYASDAPLRSRLELDVPAGQLTAWAAQGLDRLGGGLAWWRDHRTRQINRRRPLLTDSERAEMAQMWPCARRATLSRDAAYRIVWSRELEFARRYPELAAADPDLMRAVQAAQHGYGWTS